MRPYVVLVKKEKMKKNEKVKISSSLSVQMHICIAESSATGLMISKSVQRKKRTELTERTKRKK